MKHSYKYILFALVTILFACHTQKKLYQSYKMDDLDINAGNDFVRKIQYLRSINEISIIDTRADGNDFVVNRQSIFLDTTQNDQPNYYNYKKRAFELGISADSLLNCLKSFYNIGVKAFNRDSNYFRFKLVVGFTINRGYIFSQNPDLKQGDTLPATPVSNNKIVLTKQLDKNWFEYADTE